MKYVIHQYPFKFLLLTRKVCIFLFFIFHLGSLLAQNVGINVPNPAWPLDISAGQGVIRLQSTTAPYGSVLELKNNYASSEYLGAINFNDPGGSYPGQISYKSGHDLLFNTFFQEQMRIDIDGNIGIGNQNPEFPLDVLANQCVTRLVSTANINGSVLILQNGTPSSSILGSINFNNSGGFLRGQIAYFTDNHFEFKVNDYFRMYIRDGGLLGVLIDPSTNTLEISGNASKSQAGDWLANSDARLKKNIQPLIAKEMLDKLLAIKGVTYEWNDNQTGYNRPEGIQYGLIAQNIEESFPTLVEEDNLGYLQTAYGTYDPMVIEAIRALDTEINLLKTENQKLKNQLGFVMALLMDKSK